MLLLRSLTDREERQDYKHGAPDGAFTFALGLPSVVVGRRRGRLLRLHCVCSLVWLALSAPSATAQPSMQTILTNGPVSNRLNIVLLSEGYTTNQLPQFLVDATNAVNALMSHLPYLEYRSYFNAFAISVTSDQSVSDHPSYPNYRTTYFNRTYAPISDLFITIP